MSRSRQHATERRPSVTDTSTGIERDAPVNLSLPADASSDAPHERKFVTDDEASASVAPRASTA